MTSQPSSDHVTCDTCGTRYEGGHDRARTSGWGITEATTYSGRRKLYVICRKCRGVTHMRPVRKTQEFEDTPLWEDVDDNT
jgi:hypothetical protein